MTQKVFLIVNGACWVLLQKKLLIWLGGEENKGCKIKIYLFFFKLCSSGTQMVLISPGKAAMVV